MTKTLASACLVIVLMLLCGAFAGPITAKASTAEGAKGDGWRIVRTTHGLFPNIPAPGVGWAYDDQGRLRFPEVDESGKVIGDVSDEVPMISGEPRPSPLGPIKITEYATGTNPDTLESDSKGNIWFTMWSQKLGVHYKSNDTVKMFNSPFSGTIDGNGVDENDDVWFGIYDTVELGVFHTASGIWEKWKPGFGSSVAIPRADLKRGTIWYTDHPGNNIVEFNKTSKTFTQHAITTAGVWAVDPEIDNNGNVWFTACYDNSIMEFELSSQTFKTFKAPSGGEPAFGQFDQAKQNFYFSEWVGANVGMVELSSGTVTEWPTGASGSIGGMGYDPNGFIWYAMNGDNAIGLLYPNNGTHIQEPLPTSNAGQKDGGYVDQNNPGIFWITECMGGNKIAKAEYGGGGGPTIARIDVTPPTASITADQTQQFSAQAYDQSNNKIGATFAWGTTGGSVDTTGLYTPSKVGKFNVYANASGKSGSATVDVAHGALSEVKVSPQNPSITADQKQQFAAVGADAKGNQWSITTTWAVSGGSGAGTISATGQYTPDKVGQYTIEATESQSSKKGTTQVTVTPGAVSTVTVTPATATITADQTKQFGASAVDAKGNPVTVTFAWTTNGGSVSQTGLYTPSKVGSWTVTASASSKSSQASVEVTPGVLARLVVSPTTATITADATQQFDAVGFDAKNNSVDVTPTWSVDNGAIDNAGKFTPEKVGTWTVTVKDGAAQATAKVTVTPGKLVTLTMTPKSATLEKKQSVAFTLKLQDAKGNTVTASSTTWEIVGDAIGTFDKDTATLMAKDAGEADVKATVTASSVTMSEKAHVLVKGGLMDLKGGGQLLYLLIAIIAVIAVMVVLLVLMMRRRKKQHEQQMMMWQQGQMPGYDQQQMYDQQQWQGQGPFG